MTTLSIPQSIPINRTSSSKRNFMPYALWTMQVLLALTFLFAGGMKFVMSSEDLTKDIDLSATFLRFIGVCEVLGAIGLIGPGILGFRRGLTPLAASGLVIIMVGATVVTVASMGILPAALPLVVGIFAAFVAYNRRSWLSEA